MTIAFIPVRGGSKSIPLKNIKPLCGRPLVCWVIDALEHCNEVDEIIVATDSDDIANTVCREAFQKTHIYRRQPQNATDTASTESVMLEYINHANLSDNVDFLLVQATSPLTTAQHFSEAILQYRNSDIDSLLSCVRNKRFFWSDEGTSLNYDYRERPRRQDFHGMFMENGAFYINRVGNIKRDGNRLSGRIGIYEMPEHTATEIDEPDDWTVMEQLMARHRVAKPAKIHTSSIKLFLSDVDGVLTDAGMYYSELGDELKKFNTRDGMGFRLLQEQGIATGIITSETTKIVERRAAKLNIEHLCQGKKFGGKLNAAKELCSQLGINLSEVAYIGDDINCYELLSEVGLAACPADAVSKIKSIPGIMQLSCKGGDGAAREFIDYILAHNNCILAHNDPQ